MENGIQRRRLEIKKSKTKYETMKRAKTHADIFIGDGIQNGTPRKKSRLTVTGSNDGNFPKANKNSTSLSTKSPLQQYNSIEAGKSCFAELISPVKMSVFFKYAWEKSPAYIPKDDASFFDSICTMDDFKNAIEENMVYFGLNIDVTTYKDGVKVAECHSGRADIETLMNLYRTGRSIRLLNPQTFIRKVRRFTTQLQDFFRCFVGANIYLTPGNSQGFAPHYDDVEAFVLQLSGRKLWRLYSPRPGENLARFSSRNFVDADIGNPMLTVTLKPGGLLYFPRGVIHQAQALDEGSMHITVSCYQRNSYADFLEMLLPVALQTAISEDVEYRKGLPIDYLDHLGMVSSDTESVERTRIISKLKELVSNLTNYLPIDSCADQFGKKFVHDALPPMLGKGERSHVLKKLPKRLKRAIRSNVDNDVKIKLIRAYTCRLVCENEVFKLFYNTKNGLVYHEVGHKAMKLTEMWAIMTETLIRNYPEFTDFGTLLESIGDLGTMDDVLEFVGELCKRRLVIFNKTDV